MFKCEIIPYPVVNRYYPYLPCTLPILPPPALGPVTSWASLTHRVQDWLSAPEPLTTGVCNQKQLSPEPPKTPSLRQPLGGLPTNQAHLKRFLCPPPSLMPPPPGPHQTPVGEYRPPGPHGTWAGKCPAVFDTNPRT